MFPLNLKIKRIESRYKQWQKHGCPLPVYLFWEIAGKGYSFHLLLNFCNKNLGALYFKTSWTLISTLLHRSQEGWELEERPMCRIVFVYVCVYGCCSPLPTYLRFSTTKKERKTWFVLEFVFFSLLKLHERKKDKSINMKLWTLVSSAFTVC